jgi:hypothetical protein
MCVCVRERDLDIHPHTQQIMKTMKACSSREKNRHIHIHTHTCPYVESHAHTHTHTHTRTEVQVKEPIKQLDSQTHIHGKQTKWSKERNNTHTHTPKGKERREKKGPSTWSCLHTHTVFLLSSPLPLTPVSPFAKNYPSSFFFPSTRGISARREHTHLLSVIVSGWSIERLGNNTTTTEKKHGHPKHLDKHRTHKSTQNTQKTQNTQNTKASHESISSSSSFSPSLTPHLHSFYINMKRGHKGQTFFTLRHTAHTYRHIQHIAKLQSAASKVA